MNPGDLVRVNSTDIGIILAISASTGCIVYFDGRPRLVARSQISEI